MKALIEKIKQIGLANDAYCPFIKIIKFLDTQKKYAYEFIDWGYGELKIWDVKTDKLVLHLDAYQNRLSFIHI